MDFLLLEFWKHWSAVADRIILLVWYLICLDEKDCRCLIRINIFSVCMVHWKRFDRFAQKGTIADYTSFQVKNEL